MKVAIIKYNAGNIHSVKLALKRLGIEPIITDKADQIANADKVVFPGVGEAGSAMDFLNKNNLKAVIMEIRQPLLGICLGQQLLGSYSEEKATECLGIFPQKSMKFPPLQKVPHMGWNSISGLESALFAGVPENSFVYFVHSYFMETGETTIAKTDYIVSFSAALRKDNFYAVQFHPEKSGAIGEKILRNFIDL